MKPRQRLSTLLPIALVAILTCLYLAAIAGDWFPLLRGNADWRWTLLDWPPLWRVPPLLIIGAAYLALVYFGERRVEEKSASRLTALVGGALLLQIATLWMRYPHPIRLIYDLVASDSINGYYTVASGIQDVGAFLRDYPALMPTLPNHVTTHPPGLVLLFWMTGQLVNVFPSLTHTLAQAFRPLGCMHSWVQVASDSALAGGLFAYVMPLVGTLTVFPLYGLGERLYGARAAWRAAALFPILPAFVINVGQADQVYPFFAALAALLFDRGLRGEHGWPMLWAGIVLSLASFLSLGLLTLLLPLGTYTLILLLRGIVQPDTEWRWRMSLFALGLISVWLLYWCTTGVNPLDIWQGGLGTHTGIGRSYGQWLIFNLVDFLPFAGLALVLALPLGLKQLLRQSKEAWLPATLLTILALDLSGLTRGEVSRLWLFLTPALVLAASASLTAWEEKRSSTSSPWGFWIVGVLLLAQLVLFGALIADPHPRSYEMYAAPREVPPVQSTVDARFGDELRLVGFDVNTSQIAPGEKLELTLYWQTLVRPAGAYKVFIHLYDEETGVMAGQRDKAPLSRDWPTTCWTAGEIYQERFRFQVQPETLPQEYLLQTGFYDEVSGERLPVQQSGFAPDTRAILTTVKVEK